MDKKPAVPAKTKSAFAKEPRPPRVFIRTLAGRIRLMVLFSALSVAAVAVVAAADVRRAVEADTSAAVERLGAAASFEQQRLVADTEALLSGAGKFQAVLSKDSAQCAAALADILRRQPRYVEVGVASPDGAVVCASPQSAARGSIAETSHFRRAVSAKGLAMGDYRFDEAGGRPTVSFAYPLVEGGLVRSVVYATMDVASLADERLIARLPKDAGYGVLDGKATMLVRFPEADRWAGKTVPEEPLMREMLAGKRGVVTADGVDGVRRLYAYARLDGLAAPGAYVYLGIPASVAFQAVREAAMRNALVGAFLLLVALWAGLTLADLLVLRRVRKLVDVMREVILGDHDARVRLPRGMGELDELADIFDIITKKLKESVETTEERVKSRTVELEFTKGMTELEKARYEALLASIGEGVVAVDREGKIMFINQEAGTLTGWKQTDVVGRQDPAVFRLEDEKGNEIVHDQRPTTQAQATGQKTQSPLHPKPYYLVRRDRSRFPVHVTVTPVKLEGETIGVIEVFRDITDEMEFDRRKSEFISIASHQLRSPLAATKWLTDMLRKGDLGALQPKQQDLVEKLYDANERMVVLVNDLLNVSRLESGVIKPAPVETDMNKLLSGVLSDTGPLLAAKKQTMVYDEKKLPQIVVDPLLVREVVANIISNASKYSPDGSAVTVKAEARAEDILVSVADQGIGIPKSDESQMFRKFFRAENAAKSSVQGTGLGLYVVKSIVEMHGGKIWFESEMGKGTTFFFTLPLKPPAVVGEIKL